MRALTGSLRTRARADAVGVVVALSILAGVVAIGVGPVRAARASARASREAFASRVDEARELARVVQDMSATVERLQADLRSADVVLRPASALNSRMADAAALATRLGIEVDQLTPAGPEKLARFQRIPIRLAGRGRYVECVAFLEALHREFRDVGVRSVRLKAIPNAGGVGAEIQVELAWHALPDSGV